MANDKGTELPRRFFYNGSELEDPDPTISDEEVKKQYEAAFPELTTANSVMEIKDGYRNYTFKKAAGTKG